MICTETLQDSDDQQKTTEAFDVGMFLLDQGLWYAVITFFSQRLWRSGDVEVALQPQCSAENLVTSAAKTTKVSNT